MDHYQEVYRTRKISPPFRFEEFVFFVPCCAYVFVDRENDEYVIRFGYDNNNHEIKRENSKIQAIRHANNIVNGLDRKSRDEARTIMAVYQMNSPLPEV